MRVSEVVCDVVMVMVVVVVDNEGVEELECAYAYICIFILDYIRSTVTDI